MDTVKRHKILLLGDGPRHQKVMEQLMALDFADVEMRVLGNMVQGRKGDILLMDDLVSLPKDLRFPLLYGNTEPLQVRDVYNWKPEPADSLERRKEPKGPRGRWGKL